MKLILISERDKTQMWLMGELHALSTPAYLGDPNRAVRGIHATFPETVRKDFVFFMAVADLVKIEA